MPLDQFPLQAAGSPWAALLFFLWVLAGGLIGYLVGRLAGRLEFLAVLAPLFIAIVVFGLLSEPLLAIFAGLALPVPALSGGCVAFFSRRRDLW